MAMRLDVVYRVLLWFVFLCSSQKMKYQYRISPYGGIISGLNIRCSSGAMLIAH